MKFKKNIIVAIVLMLCSFPIMISAIETEIQVLSSPTLSGIPIIAGEVSDVYAEISESQPSSFGGLIANFDKKVSKILSFVGITLHQTSSIEPVTNYELLALPSGTPNGFIEIIPGGVFVESESVILEGKTTTENIWVTNLVSVKVEGNDFLVEPFDIISTDLGDIQFTDWLGENADYLINGSIIGSTPKVACDPEDPEISCPSEEIVRDAFPETNFVGFNFIVIPELDNQIFVVLKMSADTYTGLLVDGDRDGEWNFFEFFDGYSVNSWETYTLLLTPSNTFDLFVA